MPFGSGKTLLLAWPESPISSLDSRVSFRLISLLSPSKILMSSAKDCSSLIKTRNASGAPGLGMFLPLTIASYVLTLPAISSDLTVSISWSVYAAPYASRAQTSISPNLCPPN